MNGGREADAGFVGSVPDLYDRHLVPMIFDVYARDLAARVSGTAAHEVLEVAAGTGAVTRVLADVLPATVVITATDLNPPMIERARSVGTSRPVHWQQADAMALPFDDASFDVVVCQFGAMFFPDHAAAFAEVRRVLRPGGTFVFNVWDRIEANEFADVVSRAMAGFFADDPPMFMARTPHGYFEEATVRADLVAGGFDAAIGFEHVEARSHAASAEIAALAYCQGTPMRNEIVARDASRLDEATAVAAAAIRRAFGPAEVEGRISAFVVTARPLA